MGSVVEEGTHRWQLLQGRRALRWDVWGLRRAGM